MCLRKLQSWSLTSSIAEFSRFISSNTIEHEEYQFVNKFTSAIDMPRALPPWIRMIPGKTRHASIKLKWAPDIIGASPLGKGLTGDSVQRSMSAIVPMEDANGAVERAAIVARQGKRSATICSINRCIEVKVFTIVPSQMSSSKSTLDFKKDVFGPGAPASDGVPVEVASQTILALALEGFKP